MAESKQTNFRVDPQTADKFRAFCIDNGYNQAEGFEHLIQVLEVEKAKELVPTRKKEIDDFDSLVYAIKQRYINSVSIAENTEARVLEQFRSKLDSKDELIIELQTTKKELSETVVALQEETKEAKEQVRLANLNVEDAAKKVKAAEEKAADKDKINNMLSGKLAEAEEKLDGYDDLKSSEAALKTEVSDLKIQLKDVKKEAEIELERANNVAKRDMAEVLAESKRQLVAAELEAEKVVSELEKKHAIELRSMYDRLETAQNEKSDLKDLISNLKEELAELKARNEYLENQSKASE